MTDPQAEQPAFLVPPDRSGFRRAADWFTGPGQPILAIVALFVSTLGSVSSCRSASASRESAEASKAQVVAGKKIPFQSVLYSTQISQMQAFARASSTFASAIRGVSLDMPAADGNPAAMPSDENLHKAAATARPLIDAQGRYQAEIQAMVPVWTPETQLLITASFRAGGVAADCYLQLGAGAGQTSASYWAVLRPVLEKSCIGEPIQPRVERFSQMVASALGGMKTEMEATKADVGQ